MRSAHLLRLTFEHARAVLEPMPEFEGATEEVPDGVHPIFLTGSTQEHYGVHELTVDNPFKWVAKQYFLDEIKFKGAISDMYVMKKEIEKYKGDELMILSLIHI